MQVQQQAKRKGMGTPMDDNMNPDINKFQEMAVSDDNCSGDDSAGLKPGKHYIFDPPVEATGWAVGGMGVCKPQDLQFRRGFFLGMRDGLHVFQGKPVDDPRPISDKLRECYFRVEFTGGSSITLDSHQEHKEQ